jgi:hypothetical protein
VKIEGAVAHELGHVLRRGLRRVSRIGSVARHHHGLGNAIAAFAMMILGLLRPC